MDDTERSFSEDALQHLPQPVFVCDSFLRYVLVNKAFCTLLGHPEHVIVGATPQDLLRPEDAEACAKKFHAVVKSQSSEVSTLERFTDAQGNAHLLTVHRAPLSGDKKSDAYVLGIVHDVTELHEHQAQLEAAKETLERRVEESRAALAATEAELLRGERLAALGQLSAGIAHQIRNPLGAISNAAAILRRTLAPDGGSDADRALDIIQEEVNQANSIITGLLNYARVGPASMRPVPLEELVDASTALRSPPAGIELSCSIAQDAEVQADPEQMLAAMGNILLNAYEAMPDGGRVTIEAMQEASHWVLMIADTGSGIPTGEAEMIFEPLVSHKPAGTGLGLSISRVLVENQGGTLTAEDASGPGARFAIRLKPA